MTPFRRSGVRFGATPVPETPYQKAGQAWDERIGSARVQARNWRLMAFGSLLLSGGLAAGIVALTLRGSITPWVVEVDHLGEAKAVAPAADGYRPTDPQIAWRLARFIEAVRGLPADPVVLRNAWLSAYDLVTQNGALSLADYAHQADPFSLVGKSQVAVDVTSVLRASPSSFRVAWAERHYAGGQLVATEHWTAILTVVLQPPRTADALQKNPLGIFVDAISWSKDL
ncbi:conjugal transfer protein TrbF [Caulobacter sp. KR2-114]|uniref:conjugal transfer protein TrbF n=1 Tax=Caulobacter sp. KR2-114 TaxID=3400912 RepID=UPI003C0C40D9